MTLQQRLFSTQRRLTITAGAITAGSVVVGIAVNQWIRTSSTDVGMNLIWIVLWVTTMMAAATAQSLVVGDRIWGERWRRRTLLGWVPDVDEVEPEDIQDHNWVLYAVMAGLLVVGYAGHGAINGNFFGWYQFRGFDLVQLRSEDPQLRLEAVLELADHEDPNILRLLVPKIHDPDLAVRAEAIGIMGDKRVEATRDDLFKALEGSEVSVRANAAEALGKIGGEGVLRALTGLLSRETNPELLRGVIAGLGLLGDPDAGPVLIGILANPQGHDEVRAVAAWSLGRLGADGARAAVAAALSPAEKDAPMTRCAALHAMARLAGGKKGGAADEPPPEVLKIFSANVGELGHMCDRALVTVRAKERCFGKLNAPSPVAYRGKCTEFQMTSPEEFRVKSLRVVARACGKASMRWLAEVNNDEREPAAVRAWAAELFLGLKAL